MNTLRLCFLELCRLLACRLTWLVIGFITFVLVVMLFRPAQQLEVISTGLLAIGIICTVPIMARWKKLIMWQKTPIHNTR